MTEAPVPHQGLDVVEESRLYGWDGSNWVSVTLDSNGNIESTVVGTVTVDDNGNFAISSTPIDALTDALSANATDEIRVTSPSALDVSAAEVDVDIATQTLSRLIGELELEDAGATDSYANIHRRGDALQVSVETEQTDLLRSTDQPLDVSGATVPNDPTTATSETAFENGTALASGNTLSNALSLPSAERIVGRVNRQTTSYDLVIAWLDAVGGNVLFTEDIATGVAGGTATNFSEPARSPFAEIRVVDSGSGSGAVTLTAHMR